MQMNKSVSLEISLTELNKSYASLLDFYRYFSVEWPSVHDESSGLIRRQVGHVTVTLGMILGLFQAQFLQVRRLWKK